MLALARTKMSPTSIRRLVGAITFLVLYVDNILLIENDILVLWNLLHKDFKEMCQSYLCQKRMVSGI